MADFDLIIVNGLLVTDSKVEEYDVAVKGEKVAAVGPRGSFKDAKTTRKIDAEGGYVMVKKLVESTAHD